ncbi:phage head closure protein [Mangrovicoccus ximenensis]|uniref:phage head closure protein n=1 Tax=Mangrovicoccus ximenensis TaxID=1911570 RepID=UPI0013750030|nr:phage head closure protein [Mangrovicoccus ximenensis]
MIEAGKLQHYIELQHETEIVAASGAVTKTWTAYAAGRAELRQATLSEFLADYGTGTENNGVFLIRWLPGVTVSDRIVHGGRVWNIVAIAEIGRRRGLELRAVAA